MQVLRAANQQHDMGARRVWSSHHPEAALKHGVVLRSKAGLAGHLGHQPRQAEAARSPRVGPQHPVALPGQMLRRLVQQGAPLIAFDEQDSVASGQDLVQQQTKRPGPACRQDDANRVHKAPRTDKPGWIVAGLYRERGWDLMVRTLLARGRSGTGLSCSAL